MTAWQLACAVTVTRQLACTEAPEPGHLWPDSKGAKASTDMALEGVAMTPELNLEMLGSALLLLKAICTT